MKTAGSVFTIERKKTKESFSVNAILTARNGDSFAMVGGLQHIINAHILIEKTQDYSPAVGDRVLTDGAVFQIVAFISSPDDASFSCDLIQLAR